MDVDGGCVATFFLSRALTGQIVPSAPKNLAAVSSNDTDGDRQWLVEALLGLALGAGVAVANSAENTCLDSKQATQH
ncbi:hypothetical protein CO676_22270 [Sinorhizobium sp. BJ1]|nr:hypothetical protein CO676_22270 [Sinorhizobium sp. BJ1]